MCASLGYNQTNVNLSPFNIKSQKEAGMEIYTYYPLVQINCAQGMCSEIVRMNTIFW